MRELAVKKGTEVISDLISEAQSAGICADYVLFDSWFSSPKGIRSMREKNLDVVAMVKKSSKIHYSFQGELLSCKEIYARCKKRRGRSRYLLSIPIEICGGEPENAPIPAKLVFVRNRSNRKDFLALISTDTTLTEDEIIQLYGKRWDIEVFFKTSKSVLRLTGECRSLSYGATYAQCAIVFARYIPGGWYPGEPGSSFCRSIVLPGSRRIGGHIVCGGFGEIATFSGRIAAGVSSLAAGYLRPHCGVLG